MTSSLFGTSRTWEYRGQGHEVWMDPQGIMNHMGTFRKFATEESAT